MNVLTIAADPHTRDAVSRHLAHLGHAFSTMTDSRTAIAVLQHERYDVVIFDVDLPDSFAATIRRIHSLPDPAHRPYLIVVTGEALAGDQLQHQHAGADAFLSKPVQLELLRQAMAHAIQASEHASPESAPESANPATPLIDWSGFEHYVRMFGGISPKTIKIVQTLFDEHLHQAIDELCNVIAAQNAPRLHDDAHRLHGSCLQLGLPALAAICRRLETLPPNVDPQPFAAELQQCFQQTQLLLHQHLNNDYQ